MVALFAVTIVAAVVFRSRRAKGMLDFLLKVAYAYIIVIVGLAIFRVIWG
jgi:hypothetical protein